MSNALTVSKTKNTTKVVLAELQIGRFVKCILSPGRLSKLVKWFFMQHRHAFHESFRIFKFGGLTTTASLSFSS